MVDAATARAKAGKTAEEEFKASFFQGYSDLKGRVVVNHLEWYLTTYSGADLDFWEVESQAAEETPTKGAVRESKSAHRVVRETVEIVIDPPA